MMADFKAVQNAVAIINDVSGFLSTKIALIVIGFVVGVTTAFGKGWVNELYKKKEEKRKDIEKFMAKVTDVIAVATSAGYSIRQNKFDRRRMDRASFQLERLGKKKLAQNIRSYMNKWSEVSNMLNSGIMFKGGRLPFKEQEERRQNLVRELDNLTDLILRG